MTARIILTCDAVHPERTPPECRAFVAVPDGWRDLPGRYWTAKGWTEDDVLDGHRCPSCSEAARHG